MKPEKKSPSRGRPLKLPPKTRDEIGRRLAMGESMTQLATEYGVSKSMLSRLFSERVPKVRDVATRLAKAEIEFEHLPVSEQGAARVLTDQIKSMGSGLVRTAGLNVRTAETLAGLANQQAAGIQIPKELDDESRQNLKDSLSLTAALIEGSNKAATLSASLVSLNRGVTEPNKPTLEDLIVGSRAEVEEQSFAVLLKKARGRAEAGTSLGSVVRASKGRGVD